LCAANNKLYIFGGIVELTKELNDMAVFDLTSRKYVLTEECNPSAEHATQQDAANKTQHLSPNQ